MMDERKRNRIEALKEAMRKQRGYIYPQWEFVAENDVDFMEAYNNLYDIGMKDGKALPAKTRELVAIGVLAYRGLENVVYEHMKRAMKLGATQQEIFEAIETTIVPGGAPTFYTGLCALMRIAEEEKK